VNPIQPALDVLCAEVAELTARIGRGVDPAGLGVLDRTGHLQLDPPGLASPNRACRLVRAADGWIAVNLAREEDRDLVPAWLGCDFGEDPWTQVEAHAPGRTCAALVAGATLLGLPAAAVGETVADSPTPPLIRMAVGGAHGPALKVVDLSALWAGPLCGAVLAAMGASVTKVESVRRPDPTRTSTPGFFENLNGAKTHLVLDLADPQRRARLHEMILAADVLITGARPRAFAALGLEPSTIFAANPGLVWTAVTGHGWTGEAAARVGFGDDTAAAGGVVRWTSEGPRFLGDALADPVTGLAAATGTLRALEQAGGRIVDAALARSAAGAAALCRLPRAA
jgi:hypothetical protein